VNELWRLDLHTFIWEYINTTVHGGVAPPPREQHSAAVVDGNLYLFGGKSRIYPSAADTVLGDLWRLNVPPKSSSYVLEWSGAKAIPELGLLAASMNGSAGNGARLNGAGVDARSGMCIVGMQVQVEYNTY